MSKLIKWAFFGVGFFSLIAAWLFVDTTLSLNANESLHRAQSNRNDSGLAELDHLSQLGDVRWIRSHEIMNRCESIHRECIDYIRKSQLAKSDTVESDTEFADLYAALSTISLSKEDILYGSDSLVEVVLANQDVYLTELITSGQIKVETVATSLSRNRLNLAQANSLIERMIFIGAIGIDLNAANLVAQSNQNGWTILAPHLKPLNKEELSLQRTLDGELLYNFWSFNDGSSITVTKPNQLLNSLERRFAYYLPSSLMSWTEFWQHDHAGPTTNFVDRLVNPIDAEVFGLEHMPNYMDYIAATRNLDGMMALIHVMRDGNIKKPQQQPALAPLPLRVWKWQDDTTLCLEPRGVHPSMQEFVGVVCATWFEEYASVPSTASGR